MNDGRVIGVQEQHALGDLFGDGQFHLDRDDVVTFMQEVKQRGLYKIQITPLQNSLMM